MSIKTGILIINGNKLLLIKEKVKKNRLPLWNIIKGSHDPLEISETIFETAIRECLEEASVKVVLTNFFGCYIEQDSSNIKIQFNFIAKIIDGEPKLPDVQKQKERNETITDLKWFKREDILKMNEKEFISNKIYTLISEWAKGKKPLPLETIKYAAKK